jgi:hypothetical protein
MDIFYKMLVKCSSMLGVLLFFATTAMAQFAGGDGSEQNPFIISDVSQLHQISFNMNAHYVLGNNIDASSTANANSGEGFLPMGDGRNPFAGSLDGKGYSITDLTINRPATDNVGLFGYLGNGVVKNIKFFNVSVIGKHHTGVVAGQVNSGGSVENVYVMGSVEGDDFVGGIAGKIFQHGSILGSQFHGTVNGNSSTGGILGYADGASITIERNLVTGSVLSSVETGGILGSSIFGGNSFSFHQNGFIGTIEGTTLVGGLIGHLSRVNKTITNNYARGSITGTHAVGGLVGKVNNTFGELAAFENSYAAMEMTATGNIGGVIGEAGSYHSFNGVYWNSEVSGVNVSVGIGFTGWAMSQNTNQMQMRGTYWMMDFENIWKINDGAGYPSLQAHTVEGVDLNPATNPQIIAAAGVNRLSWEPSLLADSYSILRTTATNDYTQSEAISIANKHHFDDFMITPGVEYYYWIVAEDDAGNISDPVGPVSAFALDLVGSPTTGTGTVSAEQIGWNVNWEYFDFSLGQSASENLTGGFVADFRGTSNEGVNFGSENAPEIEGKRLYFLGQGFLENVRHVPFRVDANPWMETSWMIGYMPLSVGQIWVIFTSEDDYAVMEITDIPDEHGLEFSFNYMYQPGNSPIFTQMENFPASLNYVSGDDQVGEQSMELPEPFLVQVVDANGVGVAGVIVEFEVTNSPVGPNYWNSINHKRVLTDADGYAASTLRTSGSDGIYTTKARTIHTPDAVEFTSFVGALSVDVDSSRPERIQLAQNYPNPFNPTTTIRYELPTESDVSLKIYDMLGREVAVLVSGRQATGSHEVNFDASHLSSGIYLYKLEAVGSVFIKKMMLVK